MKPVTINGTTYKLSENQYKIIEFLVADAPIIKKQQLTTASLKKLFGKEYKYVCVYDNEKRKLLTKKYNGIEVYWDNNDTKNSEKLKEIFDKGCPEFEQVGQATKQVSDIDFPGYGKWTYAGKQVKFDKEGECTVGTLIIRDKQTGALRLLKGTAWFGVHDRGYPRFEARNGMLEFTSKAVCHSDFQANLLAGCRGR